MSVLGKRSKREEACFQKERKAKILKAAGLDYDYQLKKDGVAVIQVLSSTELQQYHDAFVNEFKSYPEFLDPANEDTVYVLGGFAAQGNPASFHNPTVRALRMRMMGPAKHLFRSFQSPRLEQLMDRTLYREQGKSPSKESWHFDSSPCGADDVCFGGWINLDLTETQYFSCVKGTHWIYHGKKPGFNPISKEQGQAYTRKRTLVSVPPGSWIVFYQTIVHEVLSKKASYTMMRLFLGWRLTSSEEPLFANLDEILASQGTPFLPSGQKTPMYAQNHLSYHQQATIQWSNKTFKPQCLETKYLKGDRNKPYVVVKRFMGSLKALGLPLYEEYKEEEKILLTPQLLLK